MTYSLSVTGVNAKHTVFVPKTITIQDAQAIPGGMALAQQQGAVFLCQKADGSQAYYRFDEMRSTPANPILVPVK